MVPLHTSHGWLHPDARTGNGWATVQFLGGLAAPLFLSLAGVSLGLRWAARAQRQAVPHHTGDLSRALAMIVLGYLLRLQMWIIDGAGYARPEAYLGELLLLTGYLLAYFGLGQLAKAPRRTLAWCTGAAVLITAGFVAVQHSAPSRVFGLSRVDVLQCIGGSLAIVVAVGAARGRAFAEPKLYVALGIAAAFLASWTRSWVPGPLPEPLAGYLGQWTPEPGRSVLALFPLFPWVAYTFVGAAIGLHWGKATSPSESHMLVLKYTVIGACLALATNESLPHVFHSLAAAPWLVQPVRVAYRIGLVLTLSGAALALSQPLSPVRRSLDVLGRASLLVYWVHLEFAFGAASSSFTKTLDFPRFLVGTFVLLAAMLLLAHVRVNPPKLLRRRMASASTR